VTSPNCKILAFVLISLSLADAKRILHETLLKWRSNGFALVHYGFVLKNFDQNLEKAVEFMHEGIATNEPGTQDGRFYFHLGDALLRLGRKAEAMEIYETGAKKNLFLSKYQRSLYNVDRLRSQPFWTVEQTMYKKNLDDLRLHWKQIRDEALKILNEDGVFKNEVESLKAAGDWKQFELFARGRSFKETNI
jgi:aspartate beta-hydroxylase